MCLEVSLISIIYLIQVRYLFLHIFLEGAETLKTCSVISVLIFQGFSVLDAWIIIISCMEHYSGGVSPHEHEWDEAVPGLDFTLLKGESWLCVYICLASVDWCLQLTMRLFEFRLELVCDYISSLHIELCRHLLVLVLWNGVRTLLGGRAHWFDFNLYSIMFVPIGIPWSASIGIALPASNYIAFSPSQYLFYSLWQISSILRNLILVLGSACRWIVNPT